MTVSSISPLKEKEKEKNAKEQKNLQQKEVAMGFFSVLSSRGWGGRIKAFYAGQIRESRSSSRVGFRSC